jgi:16S rRNA (cytosine1402-N4)-methyltransferase
MSTTLLEMRRTQRRASRGRIAARGGEASTARGPAGAGERVNAGAGHVPVLADQLLELLDAQPGQTAIDCTFGDGGHARLVAERLGARGTLVAIDRDPLAEERFAALAADVECSVRFIRAGYAEALELLVEEGLRGDAAYFDLGMSSMQVDTRERGFSYSYDAPLDMRMDPTQALSARDVVSDWDERRLARALRDFGEERHANAIARAIVRRREQAPIETTHELVDTINSAVPAPARFAGGHPAKRSFQALRIAVNDELDQLDRALPLAWSLLRAGGVLAGISFHSLEDRRVKRFLAARAQGCICPPDLPVCACGRDPEAALLTRRSIVPAADELAANPRASSARLRAARKLTDDATSPRDEPRDSDAPVTGPSGTAPSGTGGGRSR